jgi:hypothetical protein
LIEDLFTFLLTDDFLFIFLEFTFFGVRRRLSFPDYPAMLFISKEEFILGALG